MQNSFNSQPGLSLSRMFRFKAIGHFLAACCLLLSSSAWAAAVTTDLAGNNLTGVPYDLGQTYIYAPPSIASVTPSTGAQGATITSLAIVGTNTNFVQGTSVLTFSGTGITVNSLTVTDLTHATANITLSGAAAATARDVTVTTSSEVAVLTGGFTVVVPVPTVTTLSPFSGPTAGGASVTITGTAFAGATAVKFGTNNATSFIVNSATSISATAPAGSAGTVDVTVTTAGGTSATNAGDQFTYVAAPTVTSLGTTSGTIAGGTSVAITGTNFTGASAVKFGATNATSFTVNSATSITASSPAGSAGTVDVTVTTVGGTSATSAADQFTYTALPTVTSISPTTGSTAGGTVVVITGTNLTGATAVTFGGTSATLGANTGTTLSVTTGAHAAGTGLSVLVTTPAGTNVANTLYTYAVPADLPATITGGVLTLDGTNSANPANTTLSINGLYLEIYDPSRTIGAGPGMIQDDSHTIRVLLSSITSLVINGTAQADTFTLDYGNVGTSNFPANITVNGGLPNTAPGDTLAFQGTGTIDGTYDTSSVGSGSIDLSSAGYSGIVNFTGMEPIDFTGMALNNFTVNVDNAGLFANANLITNVASSDAGVNTIVSFLLPPFSAPTASGLEYVKVGTVNGSLTINGASTDNNYFQLVSLGSQMLGDFTVASTGLGADVIEINNTTFTVPGLNKNLSLTASFIGIGRLNVAPGSDQPGVISCSGNITLVANGDSSVVQPLWDTTVPAASGVWGTQPAYFIGYVSPALVVETLRGTIQVRGDILKTAGNDATLTMQARGTITFPSTGAVASTGRAISTNNKLSVVMQSDTDSTNAGSVLLMARSVITTNGGYLTIGGGANPATSPAMGTVGQTTSGAGVTLQSAQLTTSGGNISIRGQGANSQPSGAGVALSVVSSTADTLIDSGTGTLTISGTGGTGTTSNMSGVSLIGQTSQAVRIHSSSGNITINGTDLGTGAGFSSGVHLGTNCEIISTGAANISITGSSAATYSASIADINVAPATSTSATVSTVGGNVTFIGDTMNLAGGAGTKTFSTSGSGLFTVKQRSNGKNIDLGATDTASLLGLSTTELGAITASTLQIGDSNSGTINISAALNPTTFTTLALANNTTFAATGGFTSTLSGATNYTHMTVTGTVSINTSATLSFASGGGFVPSTGQDFRILDNDATDAIVGNFTGLAEGTTLPNFLTSGITEGITYAGGTGNDIVIGVAPTISSSTGAVLINSTTLVINGTGFSTTPSNNVVTLSNGATGVVTAATPTQLTVTLSTPAIGALTAVVNNGISSGAPVQVATIVPVITPSSANLAANASSISISGLGFDPNNLNDGVTFSGAGSGTRTPTAASSTGLGVNLPSPLIAGVLNASVTSDTVSSGTPVQVATITPVVTSSTASLAANATTVTINGFGFDPTALNNSVTFNDGATGTVTSASNTSLTVTLGAKPTSAGTLTAIVTTNSVSSGSAVQVATVIPVVTSSTASIQTTDTTVTINGFGFDSSNANNSVTLNLGATVSSITSTPTQIVVTFGTKPTVGNLTATVTSNGQSSGSAVQVATVSTLSITSSTTNLVQSSTTLTIAGTGFSTSAGNNTVTFNNGAVGHVTSSTSTSLSVTFDTKATSLGALNATVSVTGVGSTGPTQVATVVAGAAAKLAVITQPTNTTSGTAISPAVTVQIQDANGFLTTSTANVTMAFGTNPGSGTLSGTLTVAAVAGTATFSNLSIDKVGTGYTLSATSGGLTSATSNTFNITPGAPAKLAVITQPTNTVSATAISPAVTVQIQDAAGNLTTSTANVVMAIGTNPSSGTLSGTTLVAAVAGTATFSTLNIDKAGTGYTLSATSGVLTSATSNTFNITAGAPAKLAVTTQPTNTVAGVAISPAVTVQIQDAAGNLTTSTAGVVMAIGTNPGGGTLSGTTTVNAVAGTATFSTLSINKTAVGYTLNATSGGLTAATSSTFNITPAAAASLALSAPSAATAGTAFSVSVTAKDAFGNIATGYSGTVHFTATDASAVLPANSTLTSGAGSFNVTFDTVGVQTVTATDTVTSSVNGTSGSVTVSAGSATHFAVSAPANGAAGVPFNFSVTALDAYNNTAAGYTGTVHFTGGDPAATLPADYTFVPADAGIHVFSNGASLPTAGLRTLTAADTVTSSISGASSVVTVSATITGASRSAVFLDTTQADFQGGVATSLDLTGSPGDAVLGAAGPNQSNATVGTSGVGITVTTWGGQTFTPSVSGQLTKASLHLFASGVSGTTPNLTLSLRATSGGLPTGADLASTTITGFNTATDVKYTATFSSPATVTAGTQYALIIRPTANPSPGTYALTRSGTSTAGSDVYSGGTRVSGATSGTVWSIPLTGGVSTDAGFEIFIGSSGASNADLISSVKDSNPGTLTTAWQSLSWTSSVATGGVLQFQVAGSSSSSGPFAFVGPDGTAATYYATSGASLSQFNGSRYLKYRAYFTGSSNGSVTLSDVTLAASVEPTVTQTTTSQTAAASTVIITGTGFDATPLNNQVTLNNGASGTVTSATSTQLTVTLSTPPNALGALTAVVTSDSISSGAPVQVATIIPGPADHLAFGVSPSSTVAGVVISPSVTVQILDASGLLTTSTANVTLGIGTNPGSAVLNGTTTVAAINGVATFSNLSINTAATGYKLSASSGSITGATSSAFNIVPAAVSLLAVSAPASSTAGSSFNITVTALDAFLNTVTGYTGTVHFSTSDSAGVVSLPSNYTFTPGDSGAHTFTSGVTLITAGNQTVTATDTVTGSITGTSGSIAVNAAAASHFAVSAAGTATAGVAINNSVTALDPFGNTAISYTGTVHFTSTDVGAGVVLPANYTFLPGDNGVHVFSGALTFVTAGNQTLTATDTISGSITGTSAGTTVSAAAATHLAVTAPGTATAGVAVTATVTAQDQYGNTATSYLGTVNFTKTDPGSSAAVPANYNFVVGDNGVHTFTGGVTLVTAGSQTVTATDTVTGTITGTSGGIAVNPAATSHFVVTAPATAGPGTPITVTLTAEDAFNNLTPAYTGTVAFTLSDTAGGTAVPANYTFLVGDAGLHTFTNGVTFATPGVQTVTATDTVSASITGFATVNVGTLNPTPTQLVPTNPVTGLPLPPGSLYPVISQSGTLEVRVSIKNTTAFPINGFRLSVDYSAYLPFHSLVLYNRTSPSNYSEPAHIDYIDYPYPVAVNATVSLKLQFYTTTRALPNPFSPTLTVTTLATSEVSSTNNAGVQPLIRVVPPSNNILLEWDSTVGQWYRIKYSSDLINWYDCPVPVQGVSNRTQWLDDGPPFTNVPPASVGARYYLLNAISAPTGP